MHLEVYTQQYWSRKVWNKHKPQSIEFGKPLQDLPSPAVLQSIAPKTTMIVASCYIQSGSDINHTDKAS